LHFGNLDLNGWLVLGLVGPLVIHYTEITRFLDDRGCCMREDGYFKGSRNRLSEQYLAELCAHFEANGIDAIDRVCRERPTSISA
jgi:hypothetical protein